MEMAENQTVVELNDASFKDFITEGITIVDFGATWCGPCKMMAPIFDEVAEEMVGKAKFAKVDIDTSEQITVQCQVTSVPTLIVFKDGEEVNRVVGLQNAASLKNLVEELS